ncbi:hypothetical protein X975_08555, partial [Stegodyphus mimosarum]
MNDLTLQNEDTTFLSTPDMIVIKVNLRMKCGGLAWKFLIQDCGIQLFKMTSSSDSDEIPELLETSGRL